MKDYSAIIKETFERMKRNQVISPYLLMLGKYTFDEKLVENLDTLFKALV